ncbi:MAG: hybrid sensory histidine kinase BarA [Methanosaeta sp. PtaU1.Bin112]|nr:MAG: hybrid sensory histidine kinase BarA [Methanosaeta sp. PtaU1.Bin112]
MSYIASLASAITDTKKERECTSKTNYFPEDLERVKAMFLANMSHELRTPLNAIIGISSLLSQEENLNSEQKDMIGILRNSGEELLMLIENILDFSSIQAGEIRLEDRPFNLHNCIRSAIALFFPDASEKGLDLACHIEKDIPATVIGDPRRLGQVLNNLLENAIKFTEQGTVAISVSSGSGDLIYFTVRDTGIGIPTDRRDCLFQSFSQVDGSLTRKYHGVGLGLAASRRLVELMGGKIWAESRVGYGSAFHFTIRAKRVSFADACLSCA